MRKRKSHLLTALILGSLCWVILPPGGALAGGGGEGDGVDILPYFESLTNRAFIEKAPDDSGDASLSGHGGGGRRFVVVGFGDGLHGGEPPLITPMVVLAVRDPAADLSRIYTAIQRLGLPPGQDMVFALGQCRGPTLRSVDLFEFTVGSDEAPYWTHLVF